MEDIISLEKSKNERLEKRRYIITHLWMIIISSLCFIGCFSDIFYFTESSNKYLFSLNYFISNKVSYYLESGDFIKIFICLFILSIIVVTITLSIINVVKSLIGLLKENMNDYNKNINTKILKWNVSAYLSLICFGVFNSPILFNLSSLKKSYFDNIFEISAIPILLIISVLSFLIYRKIVSFRKGNLQYSKSNALSIIFPILAGALILVFFNNSLFFQISALNKVTYFEENTSISKIYTYTYELFFNRFFSKGAYLETDANNLVNFSKFIYCLFTLNLVFTIKTFLNLFSYENETNKDRVAFYISALINVIYLCFIIWNSNNLTDSILSTSTVRESTMSYYVNPKIIISLVVLLLSIALVAYLDIHKIRRQKKVVNNEKKN